MTRRRADSSEADLLDNLARIERIVVLAAELPEISPLPENPTKDDLIMGFSNLAFAYATSTALLQQALPIMVEELRNVHAQLVVDRKAKQRKAK